MWHVCGQCGMCVESVCEVCGMCVQCVVCVSSMCVENVLQLWTNNSGPSHFGSSRKQPEPIWK